MEDLYQYDQEFRDSIATVDSTGKRVWVYPKKPKGKYHNHRMWVTILLLTVFFAGPLISIGDRPFMLFNIFERKFVVFGQAFWPQDFFLLAITLIAGFVFVIFFTVIFGRLWCGWACPQTLFMEMVFRKIEYWIEGDANQQRKLDNRPWDTDKILKKTLKHLIYVVFSLLIAHTAMAYIIGIEKTKEIIRHSPSEQWAGFLGLMAFTGIFYWVFAYFREQACVAVCPYGRLQGVLLDKKSIAVMYDWVRGEPRGKIKKEQKDQQKGDCIDCKLCIHVCPTGIDIRNGTQLECVNCTACMDACDDVMEKIGKPKQLIKYASHHGIKTGNHKIFNPRVIAYSIVLLILLTFLTTSLVTRSDVETVILKVPGQLYNKTSDGAISNLYNIQFLNKTFEDIDLEVAIIDNTDASIHRIGSDLIKVPANSQDEGVFMIEIPQKSIGEVKTTITIGIYSNGDLIEKVKTKFLGPVSLTH